MNIIQERIIELRKSKGFIQEELGKLIGVGKQTVSKYEKGEKRPSRETLQKIADVFGVTTDYLYGRSDEPDLNEELFADFKKVMDRLDKLSPGQQQLVLQNMQDMTKRLEEMNTQKK